MSTNRILMGLLMTLTMSTAVQADRQIEERVASTHANGKVEIDLGEGSLQVIGWDRNEVEITGTVGDRVERIEVRKGRRKIWVRGYVPKEGGDRAANLIIHAPHNCDIDAQVFRGPITISGIEGDTQLESFSGKISVTGPCKRVEARTVNGDIMVESEKGSAGVDRVRIRTVSGAVVIRNVRREVEVESISGSVAVFGTALNKVAIESVSGNVSYDGGLSRMGSLDIDTHDGDIVGVFPASLSAEFDITSFNGKVANDFNPNTRNNLDFIQGESDPQAEIRVTSFSGNIRVSKQSSKSEEATAQVSDLQRNRPR